MIAGRCELVLCCSRCRTTAFGDGAAYFARTRLEAHSASSLGMRADVLDPLFQHLCYAQSAAEQVVLQDGQRVASENNDLLVFA